MDIIAAGKFKSQCLKLMDKVYSKRSEIIITKRNKPLVKLVPIINEDEAVPVFGCMAENTKFSESLSNEITEYFSDDNVIEEELVEEDEVEIVLEEDQNYDYVEDKQQDNELQQDDFASSYEEIELVGDDNEDESRAVNLTLELEEAEEDDNLEINHNEIEYSQNEEQYNSEEEVEFSDSDYSEEQGYQYAPQEEDLIPELIEEQQQEEVEEVSKPEELNKESFSLKNTPSINWQEENVQKSLSYKEEFEVSTDHSSNLKEEDLPPLPPSAQKYMEENMKKKNNNGESEGE